MSKKVIDFTEFSKKAKELKESEEWRIVPIDGYNFGNMGILPDIHTLLDMIRSESIQNYMDTDNYDVGEGHYKITALTKVAGDVLSGVIFPSSQLSNIHVQARYKGVEPHISHLLRISATSMDRVLDNDIKEELELEVGVLDMGFGPDDVHADGFVNLNTILIDLKEKSSFRENQLLEICQNINRIAAINGGFSRFKNGIFMSFSPYGGTKWIMIALCSEAVSVSEEK